MIPKASSYYFLNLWQPNKAILVYKKEVGCRPYILQGIAKRPYIHTNKQPTLYGELSDVPSMYINLAILAGIGTS